MIREAIFSDGSESYITPSQPEPGDRVKISLRLDWTPEVRAYLCTEGYERPMSFYRAKGDFSWYCAHIDLGTEPFVYYFKIVSSETVYYDRLGVSESFRPEYCFRINPGFFAPKWAYGAVMYQVMVDRFCRGDDTNDVLDDEYYYISTPSRRIRDWEEPPKAFDVANFYGGDLQGVWDKLDYLKGLGVEVIYFNPLFVSPSNHKYDSQDYDHIDPHIARIVNDGGGLLPAGDTDNTHAERYIKRTTDPANLEASDRFFADFVEAAHQRGIRIIIDGVFNHCGSFNKWLDREGIYRSANERSQSYNIGAGYVPGAYWDRYSPFNSYFKFSNKDAWPANESYEGWWNHNTLPKLNYEESRQLREYILYIAKKWVMPPYNADGWRLDVAADLGHSPEYNHSFWKEFRAAVKEANPQAIVLAEHYGDASSYLKGDEWDTIMNYDAFMEPVTYFLTGMEKHSDSFDASALGDGKRFEDRMCYAQLQFNQSALLCAMNQLSNHDHSRFLTRTNHVTGRVANLGSDAAARGIDVSAFRAGVVMQMTLPGAPTLYYGDEAGQVGFTDPDSRRTYPWGKEDVSLIDFHRDVIFIHKHSQALREGAFIFLKSGQGFTSYARFTDDERIIVVIASNIAPEGIEVDIPLWKAEIPSACNVTQILASFKTGYSIMHIDQRVYSGHLKVSLRPYTCLVFRHSNTDWEVSL